MAQEPEQEHFETDTSQMQRADTPRFEPSPPQDQAGPPAHDHPGTPPPRKTPEPPPPPPKAKPAPARSSGTSLISNALLMIIGAALAAGGFGLARVYAPPRPPGEVTNQPPADAVMPDDFKKLSDRVDHIAQDMDQAKKQIADRPDYAPQLKMQNDRINELSQSVTQMPAQLNSMDQKLETVSRVAEANSPTRIDALDKRVTDLSKLIDTLRGDLNAGQQRSGGARSGNARDVDSRVDGLALEQAIELYNAKKYTEARDAFLKMQAALPNDARVWYYSALAQGFTSGEWLGETERLVNLGLEKEKAGQPALAQIDAAFAGLTPATGKDWLASYRKRIGAR